MHNHEHHHHDEELLPLVKYMVNHNISHTSELSSLAGQLDGNSLELLEEAVKAYENGNNLLKQLLEKLEDEH